jgi:hypothetical protein
VWHAPSAALGVPAGADDASVDSDDEDGRELDLASMLVPPKRKQSIRSLRRHLAGPAAYPRPLSTPRIGLGLDVGDGGLSRMTPLPADGDRDPGLVRRKTTGSHPAGGRPTIPPSWGNA